MASKEERADRLKAALRANLRRRKAGPELAPDQHASEGEDQRRTASDPMSAAADAAP